MAARGDSDDSGPAAAACAVDSGGGRKVRFCGRADRVGTIAHATQPANKIWETRIWRGTRKLESNESGASYRGSRGLGATRSTALETR